MEKLEKYGNFQVPQIEFNPHFCSGCSINFSTIKIPQYFQSSHLNKIGKSRAQTDVHFSSRLFFSVSPLPA